MTQQLVRTPLSWREQQRQRLAELRATGCQMCGSLADVVTRPQYVGGIGYVHIPECRDIVACQARVDAARVEAV